jgi:hypothetical protein
VKGAVMGNGGVATGCAVCAAAPATTLVIPMPKDRSALSAHFMLARCWTPFQTERIPFVFWFRIRARLKPDSFVETSCTLIK